MTQSKDAPRISVIIPVGDRHCEPAQLYAEYTGALAVRGVAYEMIFVLDGSRPSFETGLDRLAASGAAFTRITLTRYFGEATCLMVGFEYASGDVILTLPAYFQILAADINLLLDALEPADMAISQRHPRAGGWLETWRRRTFHALLAVVTRVRFHDLGCSARAMTRKVLEEIRLYGEQQRFLPVLAERQGFRVRETQVRQSLQGPHRDMYRPRAYTRALLDIFNIFFLVRFTKKPLRFFGMIGIVFFALGALELAYLIFQRLVLHSPLADRPALMLASLFIVLGFQIFALGLLGELIIFTHAGSSRDYKVERVTQFPTVPQEVQPSHVVAQSLAPGA
jgi:glycosyltransferase involved in cell wall biosynthesis